MPGPEQKVLGLLGLGTRAGSVLPGTERVREAVRHDGVKFVILAADASLNTKGKLLPLLDGRGIPYVIRFDRDQLGAAIGRSEMSAVGVVDAALVRRIRSLLDEADERDKEHS